MGMKLKIMGLISTLSLVLFTFIFAVPATVYAVDSKAAACEAIGLGGGNNCDTPKGSPSVENTVKAAISILSLIVGIAALIMVIIGGFNYITSGGDSNKTSTAKNTILYAVIGLVIASLAQFIVRFALGKVNN